MIISDLPRDPLLCVFGYLDVKDLTNLRAVNKRLKVYAEQSLEKNWSLEFKVMNKWKEILEARSLESQKGLFGKFVSWITSESQNKLTTLMLEFERVKDGYETVKIESVIHNQQMTSLQKMMSLFGGKERFEALPVLDLGDRVGRTGYIDFLTYSDMGAPIMRGRDCYGRIFFAIRFMTNQEPREQACDTFFERLTNSTEWASGYKKIRFVNIDRYLIDEEGVVNEDAFKRLAKAIKKGAGDNTVIA